MTEVLGDVAGSVKLRQNSEGRTIIHTSHIRALKQLAIGIDIDLIKAYHSPSSDPYSTLRKYLHFKQNESALEPKNTLSYQAYAPSLLLR